MRLNPRRSQSGFSLIDMMVTLVIMSILTSVIALSWSSLRAKVERVGCSSHLRALYISFSGYVQDHHHWPQMPPELGEEGHEFYDWVIAEVKPYGGERAAWICPTESRTNVRTITDEEFEGSYVPTLFDTSENSPWEWNQPWLIEQVDNHDSGQLMILPDGTVHTSNTVMMGGM